MDFKFEPGDMVNDISFSQNRLVLAQICGYKNSKLYIVECAKYHWEAEVLTQHEYNELIKNPIRMISSVANFSDYIGKSVAWIQEKYLEFVLPICASKTPQLCSGEGIARIQSPTRTRT